MNPFVVSQTESKLSLWGRLAARPGLIVFLLSLAVGLAAVGWRANARAKAAREFTRLEAQARGAELQWQLRHAVSAAQVLGALARQGGGAIPNFQKVGAELLATWPDLASLELEPKGVVSEIVPRAGYERVIGFNVLNDPAQRPSAQTAMQRRVLTVAGPLRLYRGEPRLVVRLALFQRGPNGRESCLGFVGVSMRMTEALAGARVEELQQAAQQEAGAQNLSLNLPLVRHGGWVENTKVALESLGVLALAGLLWLVVHLVKSGQRLKAGLAETNRRLAGVAAERKQAQDDWRNAKEAAAAAQNELKQARASIQQTESRSAECQARLEASARAEHETSEALQAWLKQAESNARELQGRLDASVRAAEEAARAGQAELEQARTASAPAAEPSVTAPAESKEAQVEAAGASPVASSVEPDSPAALAVVAAAATSATVAEEKPVPVPSAEGAAPAAASSGQDSPAPQAPAETPAEEAASPPLDKPKSGTRAKRKKARRDQGMDLFAGQPAAEEVGRDALERAPGIAREQEREAVPTGRELMPRVPAGESPPPAAEKPALPSAVAAPPEPEKTAGSTVERGGAEPKTAERGCPAGPPEEPGLAADAQGHRPAKAVSMADLPVVEGLDTAEGLASAKGNRKVYLEALRHFAEQQGGVPEEMRDALEQGNPAAAERLVEELRTAAAELGATAVRASAAALGRAIHEQADPGEIEALWTELAEALSRLLADLRPVLKPKEDKPAPARRLRAAPAVDPAQLRKAVNQMLPLLAGQDPGARDCLNDNRAAFQSAFAPEAYAEFVQSVKQGDFAAAQEHLKKAVKKHGLAT